MKIFCVYKYMMKLLIDKISILRPEKFISQGFNFFLLKGCRVTIQYKICIEGLADS